MGKEVLTAAVLVGSGFVTGGATWVSWTAFATKVAVTAGSMYALGQISQSMAPMSPLRGIERGASDITTVSSIDPHRIIYGRTLTGGTLVYSNLATNAIGDVESDFLNMVIALAPHEIEGIQKVYVNSDVAIDLELSDGVITTSDDGVYQTNLTTPVVNTGTVVTGGQLNLDGRVYDLLGGNRTVTLAVGGSTVYTSTNSTGVVPNFVYQNTTGSNQNYTLTVSSANVTATAYIRLAVCNFQVSDKYKNLISFYTVNGGATDEWLEFLGHDVGGIEGSNAFKTVDGGEWNNTHTMSGIAHMYVRVKHDTATLKGTPPNIACEIKGKKTFDPRDSSTVWNDNPALMIRDYLISTDYGCNVSTSELDDDSIKAAANRCDNNTVLTWGAGTIYDDNGKVAWTPTASYIADKFLPFHVGEGVYFQVPTGHFLKSQLVTIASLSTDRKGFTSTFAWPNGESSLTDKVVFQTLVKRYKANGLADTANNRKNNLEYMLTSCAGKLAYSGGKFILYAGEYRSGTLTIDEGDMIGPISITTKPSASSIFNSVKGFYNERNEDYVAKDYPPYINAAAVTADDDRVNYIDLPLRYTTNQKHAERLASIAVLRHRLFKTVTVECNMSAFRHQVGDTIILNYARAGISNETYEIIDYQLTLGEKPSIALTLQEIASTVYSV